MKHDVDIRELRPDDAEAYKQLRIEAAADPSFGIEPEAERTYSVEVLRMGLAQDDGSYVLGAFEQGTLVGMVGFGRGVMDNTGTLFGLYVTDCHRRKSIGLELCADLLARHPSTSVKLDVLADNAAAIKLYHRLGFRESILSARTLTMIRPPQIA